MTDIDYKELFDERDRMILAWRAVQPDGRLDYLSEEGFEYGFELGWRLARGEVID